MSSAQTQTRAQPPDHHVDEDVDADAAIDEEDITLRCCAPVYALTAPVEVGEIGSGGRAGSSAFFAWPLLGPLLFPNETSDARDHCANERTFLSYLRIAIYLAVLSVAITLSFHLKNQPTNLERRMAKPLGIIFWGLSVVTLVIGLGNYMKTVNKYSRRVAIVQSGWRTQLVLGMLAGAIIGTCIVLLVVEKLRPSESSL
ncbi:hypothetical protein VFPFJ_01029 [Purpureocillium lilacinum]|uniref:DUF202 domain-containing protein n=2 Tax=Purpureocillium lilacinum TaxID=33203 RepID=A0A179I012_PURLI|nr:hypothetical protein VFPFJ_01029 [Purpureocillium lilacinum]OAQ86957.1 hypothetical protein VFPBJ_00997 [Purpureocillium lilacinum]OAQ94920.1 hypothetical protein VFPFJ_01029 [Purpureocillium lilacinum]GJN66818.1 hypothetical protein PLICBS_000840 [Purpureocillium lilacinum]GJN80758.1 hypothetical protein PLIIFM63780_004288 [Purpureocillium lilacinum]